MTVTAEADQLPPGWHRDGKGRAFSDDAARMADALNIHATLKVRGWAVFALADGRSDMVAYETREAALRSTRWNRDNFVYIEIQAGGADVFICQRYLDYARMLHEHGARMPDPDDTRAGDHSFPYHAPPALRRDWASQIRNLTRRTR